MWLVVFWCSLKYYCCGRFRDLLTKGFKGSVGAHICKGSAFLCPSSNKLVSKRQYQFNSVKEPVVSKESCFWLGEAGLKSLQPASITVQIRVADVNLKPSEFCSHGLGAWYTFMNKAKIPALLELTLYQRETVNNKHNTKLR